MILIETTTDNFLARLSNLYFAGFRPSVYVSADGFAVCGHNGYATFARDVAEILENSHEDRYSCGSTEFPEFLENSLTPENPETDAENF